LRPPVLLLARLPPTSPLLPYTTLFRSFEQRALAPTNLNASEDPAVAANKGVAGLAEQSAYAVVQTVGQRFWDPTASFGEQVAQGDRKSTRLNSSHVSISYAVFCSKKKR